MAAVGAYVLLRGLDLPSGGEGAAERVPFYGRVLLSLAGGAVSAFVLALGLRGGQNLRALQVLTWLVPAVATLASLLMVLFP
jgi:hypothetical protein